jgi:hypothetical protein
MELLVDIADSHTDIESFLGALVKLQKGTVSFIMSVRLSAWNNPASI